MERTLKIVAVCAIGAWLGAKAALWINQYSQWLWWVGLLFGGFVAYVLCELRQAISAIPWAWKKATNWRINWLACKKYAIGVFYSFLVYTSLVSLIIPFFYLLSISERPQITMVDILGAYFIGCLFCSLLTGIPFLTETEEVVKKERKKIKRLLKRYNILSACFYWLPKGLVWCFKRMPGAALIFGRFVKIWFLLVHARDRRLCLIDAVIGGAVGFLFGNADIGLIAGGIFGLVNFEIFSRRVLKTA